ncbi:hypothetical protein CQW23_27432 [Capsicum baccatum]|uniref:Uncharacterized protein n=1 Tax=Capsicum baccatum TaxID=33114 RepID=A0A2G2VDN6_CAPBA|nr:hypothetical protein CQW23_27432 [Capsicum baccatum]
MDILNHEGLERPSLFDLVEAPPKDDGILGLSSEDSEDADFNPSDPDKDESIKTESSSSDFTSDSEDFSLIVDTDMLSLNVMRVKLYDTDPNVLSVFANTDVEFVIGLGNEYVQRMGVYRALVNLGLDREIFAAHPHSAGILENSFPPSSGSFQQVAYNSPAEQQAAYSAGTYDSYRENAHHCQRHSSPWDTIMRHKVSKESPSSPKIIGEPLGT